MKFSSPTDSSPIWFPEKSKASAEMLRDMNCDVKQKWAHLGHSPTLR